MENYLNWKGFDEDNKNKSEEALRRWRALATIVNNRRRGFRKVADLEMRSEMEKKRRMMEKIRIAVYVQKAAIEFMELKLEDVSSRESIDNVESTMTGHDVYKLLSKCTIRTVAVFNLVRNLFTSIVLEVTSFVVYLVSYMLLNVVSSVRDIFSRLVFGSASFVWHKLKYYVLMAISSLWKLFSNLVLDAILFVKDLIRKIKWSFLTYTVLEATSFVVYLVGYLVLDVISSVRDIFSHLVFGAAAFVWHKLKYFILAAISSVWKLFSNLDLGAILFVRDLIRKSKWRFLTAFGTTVYACVIARTTAATRPEFERQLIGVLKIVCSVIQWIITFVCCTLADLGVKSNYSAPALLLIFSIATLLFFKKDEDATDSSHSAYDISSRNLTTAHVPAIDQVPSTANHFLLLIIRTLMNQFNLANDLHLISSPASLMAPAAYRVNQQYQQQNIEVCKLLGKYKKPALAVFYLVLEAASFLLDLFGKSRRRILLAAFLLSAFGFAVIICTCIIRRTRATTGVQSQKQLVRMVEIAFSVVQLVVTLIYFILAESAVKNNFSASVFPLVFAVIVVWFAFKHDGEVSDSSDHSDDIVSGDLPVTNIPLIEALPSTSNELFPVELTVDHLNPVRVLHMASSLAFLMTPVVDHRLNPQYQLQNIQVRMPNEIAAHRAIDWTTFTRNEDTEANSSLSMLMIVISDG